MTILARDLHAGAEAESPEELAVLPPHVRIDITEHLLGGRPPHVICRELNVPHSDVADVLANLGRNYAPRELRPTIQQRFRSRTRHISGGHLLWLDQIDNGIPVLTHAGRVHSARRIAWAMTHPGLPDGPVLPGCSVRTCVAPDHVIDHTTRHKLAALLHELLGDARP
ncbi:hypothetical protein AB0912_15390 [Streptomyces sp. NPDC007084]|uniref:hypothetical protein n=1 Tax=Streptomyces sp. NPDC007084 TaxID=3154313 RepID=UPI0034529F99